MLSRINIVDVLKIAIQAGEEILAVYQSPDFGVETKSDDSPLTRADQQSNDLIVGSLQNLYPKIPILSEEGKHLPYDDRKNWEYLWVVDPLDGTKEFIKKNGEFTVNIALVINGKPAVGVIYAPVLNEAYIAKQGLGSYKMENAKETAAQVTDEKQLIGRSVKLPVSGAGSKIYAVASRSHLSEETKAYLNKIKAKYGEIDVTSAGSSLKLCLVAEGKAHVYPRFAPTMEWDTCAGQAIVEQANGTVINVETNAPLTYNKDNLLNPWFIVKKDGFED